MALTPDQLDGAALGFLAERHLATLTTTTPDGDLHVVPVAFTYDDDEHVVRIVAPAHTVKVRNADRGGAGAVCFVDGGRWMSLHGTMSVRREPDRVADTIARYVTGRGPLRREGVDRVSLELVVEFVRGRFST